MRLHSATVVPHGRPPAGGGALRSAEIQDALRALARAASGSHSGAVISIKLNDYCGDARTRQCDATVTRAGGGGPQDASQTGTHTRPLLPPAGCAHPACMTRRACGMHPRKLAEIGSRRPAPDTSARQGPGSNASIWKWRRLASARRVRSTRHPPGPGPCARRIASRREQAGPNRRSQAPSRRRRRPPPSIS